VGSAVEPDTPLTLDPMSSQLRIPALCLVALLGIGSGAAGVSSATDFHLDEVGAEVPTTPSSFEVIPSPDPLSPPGLQPPSLPDSVEVNREARRAQEDFERFRESRIPAERGRGGGRCDEPVGRLCLNFTGDEAPPIGRAPLPVVQARAELLDELARAAEALPGDMWIAGQRVHYYLEAGDIFNAREVAEDCQAREWWCLALRGLVLHHDERWIEAGETFLDALEATPADEMEGWTGEDWVMERAGRSFLDAGDAGERERRRALLWRLADPLFLVPGNDRWTAHMARLTQVRILEDAYNAFGLSWDEDLEQILLRYGWALGWERSMSTPDMRGGMQIRPNRMVARLDPQRRRFLPMGEVLERFPGTGEGALDVRDGRQTTGYTPSYAPRIENLSSQTARFIRDDELLVVHAFAREPEEDDESVARAEQDDDPFGGWGERAPVGGADALPRDLQQALFLLPVMGPVVEDGPEPLRNQPLPEGGALEDVWTATVPRGDYILSMEAWSRLDRVGWRARQGLPDLPTPEGELMVSDPVFLDAEPLDEPETLDEALPYVLPTVSFPQGTLLRIGWEVYGIPEGRIASVSLGLEPAERSALRRLGEFFRVLDPVEPVTIRWDDAEAETPGVVFRAVNLQLPQLDPGVYDLFMEIQLDDDPPAVSYRRFHVTEG